MFVSRPVALCLHSLLLSRAFACLFVYVRPLNLTHNYSLPLPLPLSPFGTHTHTHSIPFNLPLSRIPRVWHRSMRHSFSPALTFSFHTFCLSRSRSLVGTRILSRSLYLSPSFLFTLLLKRVRARTNTLLFSRILTSILALTLQCNSNVLVITLYASSWIALIWLLSKLTFDDLCMRLSGWLRAERAWWICVTRASSCLAKTHFHQKRSAPHSVGIAAVRRSSGPNRSETIWLTGFLLCICVCVRVCVCVCVCSCVCASFALSLYFRQ